MWHGALLILKWEVFNDLQNLAAFQNWNPLIVASVSQWSEARVASYIRHAALDECRRMPGTLGSVARVHAGVLFDVLQNLWKSPRNISVPLVSNFAAQSEIFQDFFTKSFARCHIHTANNLSFFRWIPCRYVRNATLFVSFCLSIIGAALVNSLPPPGLSDASAFNDNNVRRYGYAAIAVSALSVLALFVAEGLRRRATSRFSRMLQHLNLTLFPSVPMCPHSSQRCTGPCTIRAPRQTKL